MRPAPPQGRRSSLALVAGTLIALAAPVWAPNDPAAQFREHAWAAPTAVRAVAAGEPGTGAEPAVATDPAGAVAPVRVFLFGTDQFGRDLFSRFAIGARTSLLAAALAVALTMILALAAGVAAGMAGGLGDALLMTVADITTSIPWIVVILAIRAALPLELTPVAAVAVMSVVIALASWPRPARHIRATVQSIRAQDYITAARASGASLASIATRHALPHLLPLAIERSLMLLPRALMAEVTMSALGLGLGEPTASWGTLVASLQRAAVLGTYWWTLLPLVAMMGILWMLTRLADNLRPTAAPISQVAM
jgi:peptide/nickel transport system permease protein